MSDPELHRTLVGGVLCGGLACVCGGGVLEWYVGRCGMWVFAVHWTCPPRRLCMTSGITNRNKCRLRSLEGVFGALVIRAALERTWGIPRYLRLLT